MDSKNMNETFTLNDTLQYCQAYEFRSSFLFYGILCPAIAILTLITNSLVVGVFLKQKLKSPTTTLLIGLAVGDAGAGAIQAPLYIYYYSLQGYRHAMGYPGCIYYHAAPVISTIFHTVSAWITTVLGVQRYLVVACPFRGPQICTNRKSVVSLAVVYIVAIVMYFPQFFYLEYKKSMADAGDGTVIPICECWPTELPEKYEFTLQVMKLLFAKWIPCLILIVTTNRLVLKLEGGAKRSHSLHAEQFLDEGGRRESQLIRRTSLMIVIIVICFLVVEIPNGTRLLVKLIDRQAIDTHTDSYLIIVINFCTLLNYHINFWIYVCLSEEFRKTLKSILCRREHDYKAMHLHSHGSTKTSTCHL